MIDLRQKELAAWQERNFPRARYEVLTKDELIDMILTLQMALGMAEEVGEICHHVLKGLQGIRGGINGISRPKVADGYGDANIFGEQLLSRLGVDAEDAIEHTIHDVLARDCTKPHTIEQSPQEAKAAGAARPCQNSECIGKCLGNPVDSCNGFQSLNPAGDPRCKDADGNSLCDGCEDKCVQWVGV